MKRWELKFDGAPAGYVYAGSVEEARRSARAAYKRVHPDRDPKGRFRLGDGETVESEPAEARRLVSEVYEGLRLLPGMEMAAEKLRSALVLLETAVARDRADVLGAVTREGSDSRLQEALDPLLATAAVPAPVQASLRGLSERVGVNTPPEQRQEIDLKLFRVLWEAGLVDPRYGTPAPSRLHLASHYLCERLRRSGALEVVRFDGCRDVQSFRAAAKPYGEGAAVMAWSFQPESSEPFEVLRPLVKLGDRVLQPAFVRRAVPQPEQEAVALDRALFETLERLRVWRDGLGQLALPHFSEKQRQLIERTEKRINQVRRQMVDAAKAKQEVTPPDTTRRDLLKFLIDQVHRIQDAIGLALHPDRALREAFGELVFKDVVFRNAGTLLSDRFGIRIDTEVVEGADSQALVGRFKKEPGGPKPTEKSTRIHSVVVPCYTQEGVAIRPAAVRLGVFQ